MIVRPEHELTRNNVGETAAAIRAGLQRSGDVTIDLAGVTDIDSSGAAMLSHFKRQAGRQGQRFMVAGLQEDVAATLALLPFVTAEAPTKQRVRWVEHVGEQTSARLDVAWEYVLLMADVVWFALAGVIGRSRIRWDRVAAEMASMGSQALTIVGLIAFLVGGTMAIQSAEQLRQFGANIFVVDLVGISMTRELGPLMAAIVVAGRSGSAVAAELATMVITEEVDAVRTMGLHPIRFLVVPKFVAITLTQPVLTVLATTLGIAGGFVVATLYLDVGLVPFIHRLQQALFLKDVLTGLFKSVLFAHLILTISALCGLRTRGGADEVGRSTTLSVVASIFAVVVADAATSLLFYFGG